MLALPDRTRACSTSPRAKVFIAWTRWRKAPTGSANERDAISDTRGKARANQGDEDGFDGILTRFHRPHGGGAAVRLRCSALRQGVPQGRAGYSQAVITEGGKIVWLAGQLAVVDDSGKSLAGDLDGQVRQIFKLINATLEKAGGKLSDMVQMTVFITDVRYGDRLTQIRREILGDNFPGSALITVTALAIPEAKVEIQGYAVIGSK